MEATNITTQKKKRSFGEWARSRDGQKVFVMIAFLIVPLVLLIVFTYLPFAEMVSYSFYNMKYTGARKFVGWKNYMKVFQRSDCFGALKAEPVLYAWIGSTACNCIVSCYNVKF